MYMYITIMSLSCFIYWMLSTGENDTTITYRTVFNLGGSSRGLVVRMHDLHTESWVQIPEKSTVVAGKASDINSLLCSDKVTLLIMEQTPRPRTGNIGSINKAKKPCLIWVVWLNGHEVDYPNPIMY